MPAKQQGLLDRFWTRVEKTDTCWNWTGALNAEGEKGYGVIWFRNAQEYVHRLAFELLVGPIPKGRTIDHLCRNRKCVRPEHLRAVSLRENVLSSTGISAVNWQKTHCLQGHPFTEENTWVNPKDGSRHCRSCGRAKAREYYRKKKGIPLDAPLHTRSQVDVACECGESEPWCCGCDQHPMGKPWGWNYEAWDLHYRRYHSTKE